MAFCVDDGTVESDFRYRAFLSYRSVDKTLAEKLHRALEGYKVPRELVGTIGDFGPIPARLGPIFRDRDDARTSEDIETIIAQELSKSQQLIVLATTNACAPQSWVPREIELFRLRRPGAPIHTVIGEGVPPDCFPEPLLVRHPDGGISAPLAADIRPRLKGGQENFRKAVVRLAAGLLGVPFDRLWQRDLRRRRARVALISVLGILGFIGLVSGYLYLDNSHFIREEGEYLAILKGRPGLNLPGYPRMLWTLNRTTEGLILPENGMPSFKVVATKPGESVMASLNKITRSDFLAAEFLGQGKIDLARKFALSVLESTRATEEERLNASLIFSNVALVKDWSKLMSMLSSNRSEIRFGAMKAMFRLDQEAALVQYRQFAEKFNSELLNDLIKQIDGQCKTGMVGILEEGLASNSNLPRIETVLDAAFRANCRLSVDALMAAIRKANLVQGKAIARYAEMTKQKSVLMSQLLMVLRDTSVPDWRVGDLAIVYGLLGPRNCSTLLDHGLEVNFQASRIATMIAMEQQCNKLKLEARGQNSGKIMLRLLQGENVKHKEVVDLVASNAWLEVQLTLRHAVRAHWAHLILFLREALLSVTDGMLQAEIIKTLTHLGDRESLSSELLFSNSLGTRSAYIEHQRQVNPREIEAGLGNMVGSTDEYYEGQLGRMRLSDHTIVKLENYLQGDNRQRTQAACILAMQGSIQTVTLLLRHPDQAIRTRAMACSPFNEASVVLSADLPPDYEGFPITGRYELQRQVQQKNAIEAQLAKLELEDQVMRLMLVDKTSGGFGLLGQGMRLWISEELYKAELTLRSGKTM